MFKHILIAHDLRDTADMALCRASQLAKQHGSHLTLLHVLDPSQNSGQHEKTRQALDRSLTQYAPPGTELRMLSGKPSEVVAATGAGQRLRPAGFRWPSAAS